MRDAISNSAPLIAFIPKGIGFTDGRCRTWIGTKAQEDERGRAPHCPIHFLVRTPDKPPKPRHRGARNSIIVIAGPRDNCNRHHPGNIPPPPPTCEICHIVRAHDPDELAFGIAADKPLQRIDGVARAQILLDSGRAYCASPRLILRRCQPRGQRRHIGFGLKRIARRHQPPEFVQPQRLNRKQAYIAVPIMCGVERSAEEAGFGQDILSKSSRA